MFQLIPVEKPLEIIQDAKLHAIDYLGDSVLLVHQSSDSEYSLAIYNEQTDSISNYFGLSSIGRILLSKLIRYQNEDHVIIICFNSPRESRAPAAVTDAIKIIRLVLTSNKQCVCNTERFLQTPPRVYIFPFLLSASASRM